MSLPPIDPTGAMSSGDYVTYMMAYNNLAIDSIAEELTHYATQDTINDWHTAWHSVLNDASSRMTDLETTINALKIQVMMMEDAASKL